jgi:uncharacterized protein YjbI with pentapeptide repeats
VKEDERERGFRIQPPDLAGVQPSAPTCGSADDDVVDEPVEVEGAIWSDARVVAHRLDRPALTDLRLTGCDIAGVTASAFAVRRTEVAHTRLRDCVWSGGIVQDAVFDVCTVERSSLRFSTLQRVSFSGCSLTGCDFYGATFDHVWFEHCDLTGAKFDNCTVKTLRLRSCTLLGVTGATSLKGAELDLDDLPALAPSLAKELGIRLR